MRVAIRKFDGKILEAQSNDDAPMDALVDNVINVRGYKESDVEFKILPESEVEERILSQNLARLPKPSIVTMRQARLALLQAGLLASVQAAIDGMSGDEGAAARIEWEYSTTLDRNWPLVAALASVLNLDDVALDALFLQASKL